ncbi:MAG TPA: DDE-type integrase/transposase/recombinase [Thermoanaerobaculia bacterium]|nr:DDE-type integrase/transposase/recombinase [Thermoanaerobaculia bacterium]
MRVRLLLRARELIMLSLGLALGAWRDARDPVSGAFAEHCQAEIKTAELREVLEIVRGRILRLPPRQRQRYTPEERFRIVVFIRTYGLSQEEAAETFMVDPGTIGRWAREATREPDKTTVGSLLKAAPPVRTFDEVTRELVALLDSMRVGGSKMIAQMLLRAGRKISRETVRRYRKNPPAREPHLPPTKEELPAKRAVRAREPNHVWMTDITSIPSLFRLRIFKLVVVLDVHSRFPLAFRVFSKEPASEEIAALVGTAARRFGKPQHFITDRGPQFTGQPFVDNLHDLGITHRFGAIGRSGSIAIIERLWRTLKEMLDLGFLPPLSLRHLEEKIERGLFYYATLHPHQGLGGATPAEIYFRLTPATEQAISPPRATSRDPPSPSSSPSRSRISIPNGVSPS